MFHKVSINIVNNYSETPNETNTADPDTAEFIELNNSSLTLVLCIIM